MPPAFWFPSRDVPHSAQNLARGEFSTAQFGQRRCRGSAHSIQNFAPTGLSERHRAQRMRSFTFHALGGSSSDPASLRRRGWGSKIMAALGPRSHACSSVCLTAAIPCLRGEAADRTSPQAGAHAGLPAGHPHPRNSRVLARGAGARGRCRSVGSLYGRPSAPGANLFAGLRRKTLDDALRRPEEDRLKRLSVSGPASTWMR